MPTSARKEPSTAAEDACIIQAPVEAFDEPDSDCDVPVVQLHAAPGTFETSGLASKQ